MKSFGLIGLVLCALVFGMELKAGDRPNVLFLFADDFSHEAIGSLGTVDVETPNLDKLTARSVRFSHAYNMGSWSGAVCVASRAMLNTGRYLWRANQVDKKLGAEAAGGRMWSQMMKGAGYRTFMTGKWHVSYVAEKLFDEVANVRAGMPKTVASSYNRPLPGVPDGWSPSDRSLGGFWEGGKHWSEVTADDAIGYLEKGKGAKDPFFMYVAFNAPHDPRQAPESFVSKYPKERVKVPSNFLPEYPQAEAMGAGRDLRDEKLAPFPRTEESVKVHRGEYFALITHLDEQVGRVLAALEASGEAERTWVFFTADHGLAVGHHGLMGKQNMYEPSLRVPFLVAGPGVKPGVVDSPIYLQDLMATSLDVAGVSKPAHVEFQSLLPLIRGDSKKATAEPVYGAYLQLQRAVIADGMKLVVYPKAGVVKLFDLKADPDEMKDLSAQPEMKEKRVALLAKLKKLQTSMGDSLDLGALE